MKAQLGKDFFGLSVMLDARVEGLAETIDARLQVGGDALLERLERDQAFALRRFQVLAALHHRHEKRRARLRIGSVGLHAAQHEERLRATKRIAKDAPRLIDGDRLVEGATSLGRHALQMAVRMKCARKVTMHALELGHVDGEGGLDPEACERVHVDYTVNE